MRGAHIAGGGFGTLVGAVVAGALRRYLGWQVSDVDAALIGSAALSAGVGFGHVLSSQGLFPAVRLALLGPRSAPVKPAVNPAEQQADKAPEADDQGAPNNG